MLIDHADPERLCVSWAANDRFLTVDQKLAAVRFIEAHNAFDERRLSGAVLAEQSVEGPRGHLD